MCTGSPRCISRCPTMAAPISTRPGISTSAARPSTNIRWKNASCRGSASTCATSRRAPRSRPADLEAAVEKSGHPVPKGGTVLLCTGHHERTFPRKEYATENSGVNVKATEWLAQKGVVHFGIDSMRPGPQGKENLLVHKACFELGITHIESLCNLETLIGRGSFHLHRPADEMARRHRLHRSAPSRCSGCEALRDESPAIDRGCNSIDGDLCPLVREAFGFDHSHRRVD